jgi:hypothetical protein
MAEKSSASGKGRTGTGKPDPKAVNENRKLQHRRLYLAGRIASLRDELNAIRNERKDIDGKLKAQPAGTKQKELRQRRIYVAERPRTLKTEMTAASAELKEIAGRLRGTTAAA